MKKLFLGCLCLTLHIAVYAQKEIKVACVGNSITYGAALPDRAKQSYPALLQEMLSETYKVENFGKSGATLLNNGHRPYMRQEEYTKAIQFAADIVIVHLGTNDTDPRNWPNYSDLFVNDYLELIESFRAANPKVRILIAKLSPITHLHARFESGTRDWHAEIQEAIERVALCANVQLIDFHEPLYNYPHLLPDAVHPNPKGAALLAKTVYSAITGDFGGLKMSPLYTDNMVLQRDIPLDISGIANAGEQITVHIAQQRIKTEAGQDGRWAVQLPPLPVGKPYTLTISTAKQSLQYNNVLAGEVWLCSGQSNMEWELRKASTAKTDIQQADNKHIRLFNMKARWATTAKEWEAGVLDSLNNLQYYTEAQWTECTSTTAASFSAVAYHFGKMLQDSLKVPIGLICNAVGGSPTEAWVSRAALELHFPAILRDWMRNDFIQDWARGRAALNIKKASDSQQRHPYEPCYLYESGIHSLAKYPIKGVIWYQGESNAHNKDAHEKLFKLLVDSWRKNWDNEQLPFYYVQLSSLNRPSWSAFRDSQRRLMNAIPHSGMVVSTDCGDSLDVHPLRKKPIGERLARWALNKTYAHQAVIPSGPLLRGVEACGDHLYVSFDYGQGMRSADDQPLRTFELAEVEGMYYPATAEIVGEKLKIHSDHVKRPRYVRYGWQPFTRANLINAAGLPASTFRAEVTAPVPK